MKYHWKDIGDKLKEFESACEDIGKHNSALASVEDALISNLQDELSDRLRVVAERVKRIAPRGPAGKVPESSANESLVDVEELRPEGLLCYIKNHVLNQLVEGIVSGNSRLAKVDRARCEQEVGNIVKEGEKMGFKAKLDGDDKGGWNVYLGGGFPPVLKLRLASKELLSGKRDIEDAIDAVLKDAVVEVVCSALEQGAPEACGRTGGGRVTLAECLDSLADERRKLEDELEDAKRELEEDLRYVARAEFLPPDRAACKYILGGRGAR